MEAKMEENQKERIARYNQLLAEKGLADVVKISVRGDLDE